MTSKARPRKALQLPYCWLARSHWTPELPRKRSNSQAAVLEGPCVASPIISASWAPAIPAKWRIILEVDPSAPAVLTRSLSRHPQLVQSSQLKAQILWAEKGYVFSKFLACSIIRRWLFTVLSSGPVCHAVIDNGTRSWNASLEKQNCSRVVVLSGVTWPPRGHLAMFIDIVSYYSSGRGVAMASGGQSPVMLLSIHSTMHKSPWQQEIIWPKISIVPRLGNLVPEKRVWHL